MSQWGRLLFFQEKSTLLFKAKELTDTFSFICFLIPMCPHWLFYTIKWGYDFCGCGETNSVFFLIAWLKMSRTHAYGVLVCDDILLLCSTTFVSPYNVLDVRVAYWLFITWYAGGVFLLYWKRERACWWWLAKKWRRRYFISSLLQGGHATPPFQPPKRRDNLWPLLDLYLCPQLPGKHLRLSQCDKDGYVRTLKQTRK